MKKLILIDGNAIIHRAFHALPPLTNKSGIIVNAVYGFFSMFLKIIQDLKPEFVIVCFDRKAPTFRKELFVGYQAKRPKIADDLVPQIAIVHKVLQKAKVSIFEVDGYEADDLIGTIAYQAVARGPVASFPPVSAPSSLASLRTKVRAVGSPSTVATPRSHSPDLEVIIVSGDRDMLQLVNSHVKVLAPIKGITEMILFDEEKVEEKYGIKSSQFIDYKALVGDSSDNYPGVAGIGPKTARDLLQKYETFENLYQNLSSVPEKLGKKLATDAEQASLAKKLATIVTDAPITLDLEQCSIGKFNIEGARSAFEGLGFKSLLKRLLSSQNNQKREQDEEKEKNNSRQMELL